MRKYVSCELSAGQAEKFKKYLKENNIRYETSEADTLIHFECYMNQSEMEKANSLLDTI